MLHIAVGARQHAAVRWMMRVLSDTDAKDAHKVLPYDIVSALYTLRDAEDRGALAIAAERGDLNTVKALLAECDLDRSGLSGAVTYIRWDQKRFGSIFKQAHSRATAEARSLLEAHLRSFELERTIGGITRKMQADLQSELSLHSWWPIQSWTKAERSILASAAYRAAQHGQADTIENRKGRADTKKRDSSRGS